MTEPSRSDAGWPEFLDRNQVTNLKTVPDAADSSSRCVPQLVPFVPLVCPVFPCGCSLEGVARHLLGSWTGAKDHMLQLAHRFLSGHSSPVSCRLPRELLPIPFYPVSEVWEPVNFNEEGTRLRKMLASSDLNDWLLFVVTGLNWLHGIKPDFHFQSVFVGPPSKVQSMALNLLAGEVSQFFHQCGGVMEEMDWDQKLQARTVGYDGAGVYTAECLNVKRICDALPLRGWVVWSMWRTSALVL